MSSAAPRFPVKGQRTDPRRDDQFSERKEQREDKQRQERLAFTQLKRQMSVAVARKDCLTAVGPLVDSASGDERRDSGSSVNGTNSSSDSDGGSPDDELRSASPPTVAGHCHSAALDRYTQQPPPVVIPPNSIGLTYLHSFLSDDECTELIELSGRNFERSTVGLTAADVHSSSGRTSWDAALSHRHPTVSRVRTRVAELVGVRDSQIEELVVVRYEPGQQYRTHFDSGGRLDDSPRSHTIFAYLNDLPDGDGGETEFTRIRVEFKPKKGDALLWENQADRDSHHLDGEHAGRPPLRGVKYGQPLTRSDSRASLSSFQLIPIRL